MYYVYILFSRKLKRFYIGRTANLKVRLKTYNCGNSNYTSRGVPWELVYYSDFINKNDAISEEDFFKSGRGRERRKYLLKEFIKSLNHGEVA